MTGSHLNRHGRMVSLAERLSDQRVLVVGDVMLDQFVWSEAHRSSPESVPLTHEVRRAVAPGGAASTAAVIAVMGGRVCLGGVLGADEAGMRLVGELTARGIAATGLVTMEGRPTTTKTRMIVDGEEQKRVDVEVTAPAGAAAEATLLEWVGANLQAVDAVVLSDYAKGVVTPALGSAVIAAARQFDLPVVVDPKASDFGRYKGATVVTPSDTEAERASGVSLDDEDGLRRTGRLLRRALDGSALLLTRGGNGMSLFDSDQEPVHIPPATTTVVDATGAGDAVVAALALCLAAGSDLTDAAHFASLAAGIVVGKFGTATVTVAEIRALLTGSFRVGGQCLDRS
jgi:rfaE bifunctional protein kinase chain/domain